jgi:hypothetical protein
MGRHVATDLVGLEQRPDETRQDWFARLRESPDWLRTEAETIVSEIDARGKNVPRDDNRKSAVAYLLDRAERIEAGEQVETSTLAKAGKLRAI